jgi:phospholipid transport system transporter-binding protein
VTTAPSYRLESDAAGGVHLRGVISFLNAAQAFTAAPHAPRDQSVEIDLAALDSADSATLAVLIAWSAQARRRGAKLRYAHAPQGLRNLARLCEVENLLELA